MNREKLLEPLIDSIRKGFAIPKQDLLKYFEDWEVIPVVMDDRHAVTAVAKGTEVHVAVTDGYRPKACQRRAIRGFLKPLFDRHGFLTTRIPHHRLAQKSFVERVGFTPTWKDENFQYYMLASLPFERNSNA